MRALPSVSKSAGFSKLDYSRSRHHLPTHMTDLAAAAAASPATTAPAAVSLRRLDALPPSAVDAAHRIEAASYPDDEAASLQSLTYRRDNAG